MNEGLIDITENSIYISISRQFEKVLDQSDLVMIAGTSKDIELLTDPANANTLSYTNKHITVITVINDSCEKLKTDVWSVTDDEMEVLLKIYRLYEPSDKIVLLAESSNYGSMQNYVLEGILTKEEMIEAFIE